jgi:hypothetical protein
VSKHGGLPSTVVATVQQAGAHIASHALAIDGDNLYWSEDVGSLSGVADNPALTGHVSRTSLTGGDSSTIWIGGNTFDRVSAIAVRSGILYLVGAKVQSFPVAGGPLLTLVSGQGGTSLAVTSTTVFWTPYNGIDQVFSIPVSGGYLSSFTKGVLEPDSSQPLSSSRRRGRTAQLQPKPDRRIRLVHHREPPRSSSKQLSVPGEALGKRRDRSAAGRR